MSANSAIVEHLNGPKVTCFPNQRARTVSFPEFLSDSEQRVVERCIMESRGGRGQEANYEGCEQRYPNQSPIAARARGEW